MAIISIKNTTAGTLDMRASAVIIDNIGAISAGATVSVRSPLYEFWEDATIRAAVSADQLEVYIAGQPIPKIISMGNFDNPQNIPSYSIQKTISTAAYAPTLFDQQLYADATAAGGTCTITLLDPTTQPAGKTYEIILSTAGTLVVACFAGSAFVILGTNNANITTNRVGDVIRVVSNGTKWIMLQTQSLYGSSWLGLRDSPITAIATVTANQDNWNLLTANPTKSRFMLNAGGNRNITGIVPRDATKSEIITLHVLFGSAGNFTFVNNSGSSSAGNRILIGSNITVAPGRSLDLIYVPSPTLGWQEHY